MTPERWLDTHIHVSNHTPQGAPRGDILRDLEQVLLSEPTDLRFVISCDFPWIGWMTQAQERIEAGNRFIHDLAERAPGRLYGACMVNPHFLDASLHAMDLCFGQWGFVLLGELLPYIMNHRMNSSGAERLVRHALGFSVPIQVHISTSNTRPQGGFAGGGTEQLDDLMDLAERVPEARFILAHFVGTPQADPPVVSGYLDQINKRYGRWPDSFWAEIRDFNSPGVAIALERIPRTRLLAGTDWVTRVGPPFLPYGMVFGISEAAANPYAPGLAGLARHLRDAGASPEAIDAIGFGNAAELLRVA